MQPILRVERPPSLLIGNNGFVPNPGNGSQRGGGPSGGVKLRLKFLGGPGQVVVSTLNSLTGLFRRLTVWAYWGRGRGGLQYFKYFKKYFRNAWLVNNFFL